MTLFTQLMASCLMFVFSFGLTRSSLAEDSVENASSAEAIMAEAALINEVGSFNIAPSAFGGLAIIGQVALVAVTDSLLKIDISLPEKPRLITVYRYPETRCCNGLISDGEYAFAGFKGRKGLTVFSADSAVYEGEPADVTPLAVQGNLLFLGTEGKLVILDITNPFQPKQIGRMDNIAADGAVLQDSMLYIKYIHRKASDLSMSGIHSVVYAVNVANPVAPRLLVKKVFSGDMGGIAANKNSLLVSISNARRGGGPYFGWKSMLDDLWSGVIFLDPLTLDSLSCVKAHSQSIKLLNGGLLIVDGIYPIEIWDVSNPLKPQILEVYLGRDEEGVATLYNMCLLTDGLLGVNLLIFTDSFSGYSCFRVLHSEALRGQ